MALFTAFNPTNDTPTHYQPGMTIQFTENDLDKYIERAWDADEEEIPEEWKGASDRAYNRYPQMYLIQSGGEIDMYGTSRPHKWLDEAIARWNKTEDSEPSDDDYLLDHSKEAFPLRED